MYKVIIELKKDISEDVLKKLTEIINSAFDSGVGKVVNSCTTSAYCFEFVGTRNEYECLDVGVGDLGEMELFLNNICVWKWEEDNEFECCDLIKLYSVPLA